MREDPVAQEGENSEILNKEVFLEISFGVTGLSLTSKKRGEAMQHNDGSVFVMALLHSIQKEKSEGQFQGEAI